MRDSTNELLVYLLRDVSHGQKRKIVKKSMKKCGNKDEKKLWKLWRNDHLPQQVLNRNLKNSEQVEQQYEENLLLDEINGREEMRDAGISTPGLKQRTGADTKSVMFIKMHLVPILSNYHTTINKHIHIKQKHNTHAHATCKAKRSTNKQGKQSK